MKTMYRSTFGVIAALFLSVAVHAAELSAGAYSIGVSRGDVTYRLAGSETDRAAPAGTALPQGATVKTGAGSVATIVFSSGSVVTLRPNTVVEVAKFTQAPFTGPVEKRVEPSVSETQLVLVTGEAINTVAKLRTGSEYVMTSPVGAAGVRGTVFIVIYDEATKTGRVEVVSGKVVLQFEGRADVVIEAGQFYDLSTGVVADMSDDRKAELAKENLTEEDSATSEDIMGGDTGPGLPITDLIGVSIN